MTDELLYHQYANWKLEYNDLFAFLTESKSVLFDRFKYILDVVDFMYNKLIDDPNYNDDDHEIFQVGFMYLFDQIEQINEILNKVFNNDLKKIMKFQKEINLLLNAIDFQNELFGYGNYEQEDMEKLVNFENEVLETIEKQEFATKEMFSDLDKISFNIFEKMNVDFYPIYEIYFEIADELGIV